MIVLSLFDGISCGQLALERAGIPVDVYFASEIDKNAIKVTQHNFPNTIQIGNVNTIDWNDFVGGVDLLMGGSPCQDLSIAKKNREGLGGGRSGLFFKFVEALRTIKPKYFLLENVASMSNGSKDIITDLLKEIYPDTKCLMINSALVSAQNRKRLYWCNWDLQEPEDKHIMLQDILETGYTQREKSKTLRCKGRHSGWGNKHEWDMPNKDRVYTMIEMERLQTLPDNYTSVIKSETKRSELIGNGFTVDVIARILEGIKE